MSFVSVRHCKMCNIVYYYCIIVVMRGDFERFVVL